MEKVRQWNEQSGMKKRKPCEQVLLHAKPTSTQCTKKGYNVKFKWYCFNLNRPHNGTVVFHPFGLLTHWSTTTTTVELTYNHNQERRLQSVFDCGWAEWKRRAIDMGMMTEWIQGGWSRTHLLSDHIDSVRYTRACLLHTNRHHSYRGIVQRQWPEWPVCESLITCWKLLVQQDQHKKRSCRLHAFPSQDISENMCLVEFLRFECPTWTVKELVAKNSVICTSQLIL